MRRRAHRGGSKEFPGHVAGASRRGADPARLSVRNAGARHSRRADAGLEKRAADHARICSSGASARQQDIRGLSGTSGSSYEAFVRAALAMPHAWQQAGVKKGDRVAIAMRNLPEWPAAFFGCLLAGGGRDSAQRLVDRAGAAIWPQRFRRQDRYSSTASGSSGCSSICTIARRCERVFVAASARGGSAIR